LLAPAVAPQLQPVRLGRVDAELGPAAGADAPGPGVAEQAVGQQAELVRPGGRQAQPDAPWAQAGAGQPHDVVARRQVGVDGAAGPRAGLEGFLSARKFQQDFSQGLKTLVTDVTEEHGNSYF